MLVTVGVAVAVLEAVALGELDGDVVGSDDAVLVTVGVAVAVLEAVALAVLETVAVGGVVGDDVEDEDGVGVGSTRFLRSAL